MRTRLVTWSVALLFSLSGLQTAAAGAASAVDFVRSIKPILEKRCINCHHTGALFGDLSLENRAHAFKKRPTGSVIVPGKPFQSRLFLALSLPKEDRKAMPPTGHRIPDADKELLREWIGQGAKWPTGSDGVIKPTVAAKGKRAS